MLTMKTAMLCHAKSQMDVHRVRETYARSTDVTDRNQSHPYVQQ